MVVLSPSQVVAVHRGPPNATVRALGGNDLEPIRQWRNEQMDVLRQSEIITKRAQRAWYQAVYLPTVASDRPTQLLFVLRQEGERRAYGGFTYLEWNLRRAELSFLAAPSLARNTDRYAATQQLFFSFLLTFGFERLHLTRLFTETYAFRADHIRVLECVGLQHEGTLRRHGWGQEAPVDSLIHGILVEDHEQASDWDFG
jgi:RimJ/RimL family protein N-acetyltransferase